MSTEVVNLRVEDYDVYIGRGSKWGNPFKIGEDGDREQVVKKYEEYINNKPELLKDIEELKNKKLGCFCKPKACHGDILLKLINNMDDKNG